MDSADREIDSNSKISDLNSRIHKRVTSSDILPDEERSAEYIMSNHVSKKQSDLVATL